MFERSFVAVPNHKSRRNQPIAATSIINGAFADLILGPGAPLFDTKHHSVSYWGDKADWKIDFATTDDTADYTAAAALDAQTPRFLRIASFQLTPTELAAVGKEIAQQDFQLVHMGSMEELSASTTAARAANPAGETEIMPAWQGMQYVYSMLYVQNRSLDNDRYPDVEWWFIELINNSINSFNGNFIFRKGLTVK